jgi:2,4-dienoyl-CoA reductase (NADPH2)
MANLLPPSFGRWLTNLGWRYDQGINLELAREFKQDPGLQGMAVIANGGFQQRSFIEQAIDSGGCDLVSMARALIANPGLIRDFASGKDRPEIPCTYCNKCVGRTGTSPLGCYDISRFNFSQRDMFEQIMAWNQPDPV